jgi:hypothetical protein
MDKRSPHFEEASAFVVVREDVPKEMRNSGNGIYSAVGDKSGFPA